MIAIALAAAVASAAPAPDVRSAPAQQARAAVRIVRPAMIRGNAVPDESLVRIATVREANGPRSAKLIEFY